LLMSWLDWLLALAVAATLSLSHYLN